MPPNVLKAALAGALTLLENGIYKLQGPKVSKHRKDWIRVLEKHCSVS